MKRSRGILRWAAVVVFGLLASGCGSVTVTRTNEFLNAAKGFNDVVAKSNDARIAADEARKMVLIAIPVEKAQDAAGKVTVKDLEAERKRKATLNCVVSTSETYVRIGAGGATFLKDHPGIVQRLAAGSGSLPEQCQELETCESGKGPEDCKFACYSANETACIQTIVDNLVKHADQWSAADKQSVKDAVSKAQYPSAGIVRSLAEQDAMAMYSEYLDLLTTAATPPPPLGSKLLTAAGLDLKTSLQADFKDLAARADSFRTKYNSAADFFGSSSKWTGVSKDQLGKEAGAIGALADTLQEIRAQDIEAKQIAAVVRQHQAEIHQALTALADDVANDIIDAYIDMGNAYARVRIDLQTHFNDSTSLSERVAILEQLKRYPVPLSINTDEIRKKLKEAVLTVDAAHQSLVKLIEDPTKADEWAKLKAAVSNIKTVVNEANAALAAFK